MRKVPLFDLDGTLVDSDAALTAAFVELGVDAAEVTFGHVLADECARHGLTVEAYLAAYDTSLVRPFPGIAELLDGLERWGVVSNKHPASGRAELARFGWRPAVACFADSFGGGPKRLGPALEALGIEPTQAVFVGDTAHDRDCAEAVGCGFALAGWNPRAVPEPGDVVLRAPGELVALLG